jgi:hypothetical protein
MRLCAAAMLTLAVGLVVVGLASAEDAPSANWLTNLFARPAAKAPAPDAANTDALKPLAAYRRKQLKADLDRRQEVCLRLREIAHETNDDELMRRADQLDQRAWDTYVAAKNRAQGPQRLTAATEAKKAKSAKGERE